MIKKIMLTIALSVVTTVSFAAVSALPPAPAPGISCKTTYNPDSDKDKFCGCYQEQQKDNCNVLHAPGCSEAPEALAHMTYSAIQTMYGHNISKFCNAQVKQLNGHGKTTITVQNCMDDVTVIMSTMPSHSYCVSNWNS